MIWVFDGAQTIAAQSRVLGALASIKARNNGTRD
jgi:hypothetical protein